MARAAVNGGYPLTPLQEGMLFNAESAPGSGVDVVQVVCVVDAALDAGRLGAAWGALVDRHGILRTAYAGGEALEAPRETVPAGVAVIDGSGSPGERDPDRLARHLEEERRRGFAIGAPPLIRLSLLREQGARSTLVLTLHHVLLDGWSYPLLLEDLLAAYESPDGEGSAPGAPRGAFRSYVGWLGTVDHAASRPFWQSYLEGFRGPTPLPHEGGIVAPAGGFISYGRVERRVPPAVLTRLRALADAAGVRFTTLLHAAWGLLLARYAGLDESVFGETRACRRAPVEGIAGMLGCLINTVPVCVRVRPDMDVAAWLSALEREHAPVRAHERTPLARVREWIGVPGDTTLFDSLLVYNSRSAGGVMGMRRGTLRVSQCSVLSHTNFPLVIEVSGEEGACALTYMRDRYGAGTAGRIADNLVGILSAFTEVRRVGDIPSMTPAEERIVVRDWNDTTAGGGPGECVHDLIVEQAARSPGAVAARCAGVHLTYAALEEKSAVLARRLAALGAAPGQVVGIALGRSCPMMIALLGALRSGAAFLPLDTTLPAERLRFMTRDAGCRLIVTSTGIASRLEGCTGTVVDIDGDSAEGTLRPAGPDDPAYVMYTSGSTGKPRGIAVLHRGLSSYVTWSARAYPFGEGSGSLVHTSIGFDLTVTGLFPPLLCGKEVELLPESAEPEDLAAALLARPGYSVVKMTPAHLDLLTALVPEGKAGGLARAFVIGGSQLRGDSLRRWLAEAPETALFNEYGPTETVVGCCVYRVPRGFRETGPVPIGRPVANTRLYITDGDLRPVPIGAAGELCIGGEGVAAGYVNDPALTAAKFVADPFLASPGARLYRSGDRARYRPDGTIEYIGRADGQLKVRGFRVEPGEIEGVLLAHGSLREAAVIAREDASGASHIEAYCVPLKEGALDVEALRAHARRFLPTYMLPAVYVPIPALPLTARGKVDARALASVPAPAQGRAGAGTLTATEESIAALWREILGVSDLSGEDNFFERGGHSLLVMRLISRIRSRWNADVRISEIFAHPTLAAMAALVERRTPGNHAPGAGAPGEIHTRKEASSA